jgi:hypothetical protein
MEKKVPDALCSCGAKLTGMGWRTKDGVIYPVYASCICKIGEKVWWSDPLQVNYHAHKGRGFPTQRSLPIHAKTPLAGS